MKAPAAGALHRKARGKLRAADRDGSAVPGISVTARSRLSEPRIVVIDAAILVRLMRAETVHISACNVSLVPRADVPALAQVLKVMRQAAKEAKDARHHGQ